LKIKSYQVFCLKSGRLISGSAHRPYRTASSRLSDIYIRRKGHVGGDFPRQLQRFCSSQQVLYGIALSYVMTSETWLCCWRSEANIREICLHSGRWADRPKILLEIPEQLARVKVMVDTESLLWRR